MIYLVVALLCVNIIYPLFIALSKYINKKNVNYYPNIIRLFMVRSI